MAELHFDRRNPLVLDLSDSALTIAGALPARPLSHAHLVASAKTNLCRLHGKGPDIAEALDAITSQMSQWTDSFSVAVARNCICMLRFQLVVEDLEPIDNPDLAAERDLNMLCLS